MLGNFTLAEGRRKVHCLAFIFLFLYRVLLFYECAVNRCLETTYVFII